MNSEQSISVEIDVNETVFVRQQKRLLFCIVTFWSLLVAATWPLWISVSSVDFPKVPLLGAMQVPFAVDVLMLIACGCGAWGVVLLRGRRPRAWATLLFLVAAAGLVGANQHRLQPWFYQMVLLIAARGLLSNQEWLRFARWHLISIYLFSAWSKLDFTFVQTLGQQFLNTTLPGFEDLPLDASTRAAMALVFPMVELLLGIALMFSKTRRWAAGAAVAQHVVLLAILGPWGLRHQPSVLLWNLQFIVMLILLFLNGSVSEESSPATKRSGWIALLMWGVLLLPILENVGRLDHWLAWQLYAPRNSRARLQFVEAKVEFDAIPARLQPYVRQESGSPYWSVNLDTWSLDQLYAPIYPQGRFQVGVAWSFAEQAGLSDAAVIVVEGPADRWTGERANRRLQGVSAWEEAQQWFWFNTRPADVSHGR